MVNNSVCTDYLQLLTDVSDIVNATCVILDDQDELECPPLCGKLKLDFCPLCFAILCLSSNLPWP